MGVTADHGAATARDGTVQVDAVVTYRWNTQVVPDAGPLAGAQADLERMAGR